MITTRPTWLYKPIDVKNLEQIKKECFDIFNKHYFGTLNDKGFIFQYIDQDIIRNEAPLYIQALKDIGVYERLTSCIFIGLKGDQRLTDSPIHIDTEDWESRSYALNMPVVNCQDSYTVWYDSKIKDDPDTYIGGAHARYRTAICFKEESSIEIGRWCVNNPAWVNVVVPHRAENNNPDLRLIISSRFWPEIHEYFDDADS